MTNRNISTSRARVLALALGMAAIGVGACGEDSVTPPNDAGGSSGSGGTGVSGGSGGSSSGGVSGTTTTGGTGMTGGAAGATGGAGMTGGTGTTGGTGGISSGNGGIGGTGGTTGGTGATSGAGGMTGGTSDMTGGAGAMGGAGVGGRAMGGAGAGGMPGGAGGKGGSGGMSTMDNLNSGPNTMGWIGCSMGENTANGYRRIGGTRMWAAYGNGGAVVQSWTSSNSASWQRFDRQAQMYGTPKAVWIMICVFTSGATIQEVRQLVANTRTHAPGAYIYISGQPLYNAGHVCTLSGPGGPEGTDELAQQMAMEDPAVHYAGPIGPLNEGEYLSDTCHANTTGEDKLGRQVKALWGQP